MGVLLIIFFAIFLLVCFISFFAILVTFFIGFLTCLLETTFFVA